MSFLDKVSNNKTAMLLAAGGVALAGALAYLYKSYNNEQQTESQVIEEQQPEFNLDNEIKKIKSQINLQNPSLQDIKTILSFSLDASKKEIFKFSKNFKKDRKKYNKQKRDQNLDQYLRMIAQGMTQIQQIGMSLQQQIMMKIGIQQYHFAQYQQQLGPFLQEQMMSQGIGSTSGKELTLDQVKRAINLQIDYMAAHGEQMADKLINTCGGWSQEQKTLVPTLISVYIADEVFEDHPEIDEDDLQGAEMKFQYKLQNEMYKLQEVMGPIMRKLTQGLGFGGMGGYGGMDMGGMDMMGGMGGQGPTMEQLEQLRMQDPQAFEQLMYMMSQQMQR